ncbi:MAG: InlB B-repeat-containing protein [Blautia hansenii]
MKNWKRFIAACLSVTMIASTPLTTFAESSVSVEQLMLQKSKEVPTPEEKTQETEFEKILTNKTPYEYFAKLKKQQNILDTLKDEELFQLKELMKYAYIHESSSENRQSLDAYMLILETWKKRDIQYEEKVEKALVQEGIEKSSIYETEYDKEKKVIDVSSYLDYLSTIKKFDVPKYMQLLTGLEKAKTDEDLEKAKSAFKDFEEQVYGFKEQEQVGDNTKVPNEEKTPEKEKPSSKNQNEDAKQESPKEEKGSEEKAIDKLLEDGQYIKVYYLIYDGEEENVFSNFVVHSPYEILEDGTLRAVINAHPDIFDYNNGGKILIDVDINRGMHEGMQIPITEECVYNEEKGYVDIPAQHAKKDLTVTVWQARDSKFYKGLMDEVKPQEDRTGISTYGIFNDFFPSGTIPKDFAAKGCNIIELNASIDSVSVGQQWNATGTTWYIANKYNDDSYIWSDVAGAYQYDADFSQGQIINITSCDNPIFNNIGGAGPEGKNWIFTGCLSSVNNTFAGVPVITDMDIECIAKDGDYATFFMRARCKSPKGKAAQTVGGFFKAKMKNTYTMTYDGNGGLYGSSSTWSEEVVYKTDYTTWDNFFTRPGYTFTGWNTKPDGSGDDWTPYIGKPWNWWYTWDVTLYAQWKPNVLTIDYYSNGGVWTGMNSENSVAGKNQYITSYDYYYDKVDSHWNYSSLGLTKEGHDNTGYWGTTTTGGKLVHEDDPLTGKQMAEKYGLDLSTGSKNLLVYAQWTPKNVSNTIGHYLWGFKNGEGPDSNGSSFHIKNTNFDAKYNGSFVMDSSRNIDIPNGYCSNGKFGTSAIDGSWKSYPLGTKVTQTPNSMFFEYDYDPINYSITYNLNGGTNNSSNPTSYNVLYGKSLSNPTKPGYVFKGWEENLFVDSRVVPEEGSSKSGSTHTFVNTTSGNTFSNSKIQIWDREYKSFITEPANGKNGKVEVKYTHNLETGTYAIRFGANGSTDDSCSHLMNVYFEKGKTYTISYDSSVTSSKVVMSNIKILDSNVTGINAGKNATFSSADQLYSELAKRKVENVVLTAKWAPITYTVKYDGNGATSGSTASSTHEYNVEKNLTPNGFNKTGNTFVGWNTKPDGSGTAYVDKQVVKNLTDVNGATITLYAQWKPKTYTNTISHWMWGFKNSEGNSNDKKGFKLGDTTFKADYNSTFTMDAGKKVRVPNGYHLNNTFGTSYISGSWKDYPMGTKVTQKDSSAQFEYDYYPDTYKITYNLDGGKNNSENPSSYNVLYGVSLKNPTKTGYIFNGWYDGDKKVTGINEGKKATFTSVDQMYDELSKRQTGNIVLTAKWSPITYTIKYNGNGATSGSTADSTHVYDVAKNLTANGFEKIGYTFTGWNTKPDGSGTAYKDKQSVKNLTSVNGGIITLYAQWRVNKLYIQYNVNGGSFSSTNANLTVDSQGYVLKNGSKNLSIYNYGDSMDANGLANWDNPSYINAKKTGYLAVEGKEWKATIDGQAKYFSDTTVYKVSDIADISKGDKTVVMYINWSPKKLITTFHRNTSSTDTTTAQQTFIYDVIGQKFTDKGWSKTGYTLLGWSDSKTAKTQQYSILSDVSNAWIEQHSPKNDVYAVWKANTYTIKYDGNGSTSGSTPSSTHTYDEAKKLTPNGFHKDGYIFDGWNTKPDGSGTSYKDQEEVKNLTDVNKATVILYAKWKPITYHIHYKGNGSLSGKDKTDTITQKEIMNNSGYSVRENKGYTDFALDKSTFTGWYSSSVVNTQEEMKKIYKTGAKLTLEVLQKIHEEQLKNHIVTDKGAAEKDIVLYAVWDKAPEITIPDNFKDEFYEGTTVTRDDLLKGIMASDKIDVDLSKRIIITQIDYSAGRLNGSGKDKAYSQKWKDGMPADAVLDTWFMKLDKNDSPVKHKITYQVKDSAGNVTTATKEVRVIYNEFPEIKAVDQKFTLDEAQNGLITEDALLQDLINAGTLSASDKEEDDLSDKLELVDFDPSVFISMKKEGFVPITYRVQDSMGPDGNGKETLKTVYVHIFVVRPGEDVKYVRFINKAYYEKNANLPLASLTEQEIALHAVNGGLHPKSKWYTDPSYASVIKATFNKTSGDVYTYTKEDIEKMRDFVKAHGVGNAKETDGLNKFADTFMSEEYAK